MQLENGTGAVAVSFCQERAGGFRIPCTTLFLPRSEDDAG